MSQQILVIGGTGKTGRHVVKGLQELGHQVRIGSRSGSPAFDWNDPATYRPVLAGMDRAYVVYSPDLAVPGAKKAIRELTAIAREEGLQKLVLLSGKGEQEAEACEEIVAQSGVPYTITRASWFNQNFSESFLLEPILSGQVALPMATTQIPFVDVRDIAATVLKVLLNDRYNSQIVTVTGPRMLTFPEAVATIAQYTGRDLTFTPISMEAFNAGLEAAGLPPDYRWLLDYLFREVLGNPENQEISHDLTRVLGRSAIDFADYVKETARSKVWQQAAINTNH